MAIVAVQKSNREPRRGMNFVKYVTDFIAADEEMVARGREDRGTGLGVKRKQPYNYVMVRFHGMIMLHEKTHRSYEVMGYPKHGGPLLNMYIDIEEDNYFSEGCRVQVFFQSAYMYNAVCFLDIEKKNTNISFRYNEWIQRMLSRSHVKASDVQSEPI